MKVNAKKILLITIIFIFVLIFLQTISFAGDYIIPNNYKETLEYKDAEYLFVIGGRVLRVLRNISVVVSVLTLSIIGVRYMVGSVEQKAEYKQTLIPVVIGCIFIGSLSLILTIIQAIF